MSIFMRMLHECEYSIHEYLYLKNDMRNLNRKPKGKDLLFFKFDCRIVFITIDFRSFFFKLYVFDYTEDFMLFATGRNFLIQSNIP